MFYVLAMLLDEVRVHDTSHSGTHGQHLDLASRWGPENDVGDFILPSTDVVVLVAICGVVEQGVDVWRHLRGIESREKGI